MAGTFRQRTAMLMDNVGGGKLIGSIVIDQVYARYQHEKTNLRHPRGGGRKFLTTALFDEATIGLNSLARSALRGDLNITMTRVTEHIAARAERQAPRELGDLARSATVTTIDRGRIVYRRKGEPRLTEAQINAKRGKTGRHGRRR
jgi:hypothetical protein